MEIRKIQGMPDQATSRDKALLSVLSKHHCLYEIKDIKDSDKYDKELGAFEAKKKLDNNEPLVVKNPLIGQLKESRIPEDKDFIYVGEPTREVKDDAKKSFENRNNVNYEGIIVNNYNDLRRLNAAEGLTNLDTSKYLSPAEKEVASILKQFRGEIYGIVTTNIDDESDDGITYYFTSGPDYEANKGIYDPDKKKGAFLGMIGGHPDRLTILEAIDHLKENKQIIIIDDEKREHTVNNFNDLKELNKFLRQE